MRPMILAVLLLASAWTFTAARAAADVTAARVQAMLGTYEAMPARDQWLSLGSEVVPILIATARDPEVPMFRRVRALTVLGYFATPDARATLLTVASSDASPSLRQTAMLALAHADPDRAMPVIEEALRSPDPLMRQTAAKALGSIRTGAATQHLRDLVASEKSSAVRDQAQYELDARRNDGP